MVAADNPGNRLKYSEDKFIEVDSRGWLATVTWCDCKWGQIHKPEQNLGLNLSSNKQSSNNEILILTGTTGLRLVYGMPLFPLAPGWPSDSVSGSGVEFQMPNVCFSTKKRDMNWGDTITSVHNRRLSAFVCLAAGQDQQKRTDDAVDRQITNI